MIYTTNYTIDVPKLKSSTRLASYNKKLGNFTYNYEASILDEFHLHPLSFCFFIYWENHKKDGILNPHIWLKRELSIENGGTINIESPLFTQRFFECEKTYSINHLNAFTQMHKLTYSYMLIKDLHNDMSLSPQSNVAIEINIQPDSNSITKRPIPLEYLQRMLISNSNGKFKNQKPLNYYETDLEHYLSCTANDTGALFPGDCDMLLFDDDYKCKYILEFKKCTNRGNIPIQNQSLMNYMNSDFSKYTRLNILRKHLENIENTRIPLINIFYPTTEEKYIKLESISHQMKPDISIIMELDSNSYQNQKMLLSNIINNY